MLRSSSLADRLNPITLTFRNKSLEIAFRVTHGKKMLAQVRWALTIAASLYLIYAVLDFVVLAEGQLKPVLIRTTIIFPIFILGFIATYKTFFRKRLQQLVMLMVFAGGVGLSIIIGLKMI